MEENTSDKENSRVDESMIVDTPSLQDNVFLQDILETTTQLPIDNTMSSVEENPKPAPRYGHAACKYEGELNFSFSSHIIQAYDVKLFFFRYKKQEVSLFTVEN